jgi:hypothetical protein
VAVFRVVVSPTRIAPAALRRATAGESAAGTFSAQATEPKVVRTPAVSTRSLTVKARGLSRLPRTTAASASRGRPRVILAA